MVKIRLQRLGAHKSPFYRVVVTDSRNPRDGRFIEVLGTYNPVKGQEAVELNEEKALAWLANGAQPSDTVKSLFNKLGLNAKFANQKASK